jgi:hypothetical protein
MRRSYLSPRRGSSLSARAFFEALPVAVLPRLPIELRGFETARGYGRLLKFHYGRPQAHYEAWHHSAIGRLEVGLHFEGSATFNQAAFDYFRARIVEVKASLPRAELEPWDKGWTRLYETLPAPYLDHELVGEAGARIASYIAALAPLLQAFLADGGG